MHPTTLNKAWQDGENLYHHARAVIVIDDKGNVVETIDRISGSLVNILVVLGPITLGEAHIRRAVRAEVGFGRTAPYKLAEKMIYDEKLIVLPRVVYQPLSEDEQASVFCPMTALIQRVIDKEVMHRKRLTYYKNHKPDSFEFGNGKFITVPSNLSLLTFVCLAKDMKTRESGHLKQFATIARADLSMVRYATYSPKELRRIKVVQRTAYVLGEAQYGETALATIREIIGGERTKERALFEQILEVYKIVPSEEKDSAYISLKERYHEIEQKILTVFPLDTVTHPKREKKNREIRENKARKAVRKTTTAVYKHADGCLRIEVRPSQEAIKQHREQTQQSPMTRTI